MEGGHELDTASGDIVTIIVPPDPPYGAIFEPDNDGKALVLRAYEKVDGRFGPLQKHKGIHYGDVLFGINDVRLDVISFPEALAMLNDRNLIKKQLKFINNKEYYIRKRASGSSSAGSTESAKQGFMSTIPRFKLNESGPKPFAEFEIKCQMRVPGSKIHKDIVHKWSIWRRYSEFEALNAALKAKLGWLMKGCEFPPAHNFSLRKLEPDFLEERKEALNKWWGSVLKIDKVAEFTKHFCSEDLKRFIEVDEQINNAKLSAPEVKDGSGGGDEESSGSAPTRLQKTQSMRRRSLKVGGDSADVFSGQVTSVLGSSSSASASTSKPSAPPSNSSSSSASNNNTASTPSASASTAAKSPASQAKPPASTAPSTSSSSSNAAPAKPAPAPSAAPKASAPPQSTSTETVLPPKASGARANLFADIQKRRIE